eukprot:GEMP01009004.1.p1 GENE.GEMP01009004.1~~GEMP01009004.1.p1  ORF type:complete len:522 (+),score=115.67 GEMP01009004.1:281-1846(+)
MAGSLSPKALKKGKNNRGGPDGSPRFNRGASGSSNVSGMNPAKLTGSVQDKVKVMRRNFALQVVIPVYTPGSHVDTRCEITMYKDAGLVCVTDKIPAQTTIKVINQMEVNKKICAIKFAYKVGYIKITGESKLNILPSAAAPLTVDKQYWPSHMDANSRATLGRCIQKYNISSGNVMQVLFDCSVRESIDGNDNPIVDTIKAGTHVVLLQMGAPGRFVRLRRLDSRATPGWILAIGSNGIPILGYPLADPNCVESDTGARLEAIQNVSILERNQNDQYVPVGEMPAGSQVRVLALMPPTEEGSALVKLKVIKDDESGKTGYVSFYSASGPNFVATLKGGNRRDPLLDRMFAACKKNDLEGFREITSESKGFCGKSPPLIDDINAVDDTGKSSIFYALGYGNLDCALYCLRYKSFNPHVKDNCKHTALHYACRRMSGTALRDEKPMIELVNDLVRLKADIDVADVSGHTPLMYAVQQNQSLLVRRLLDLRANPGLKTVDKLTAQKLAMEMEFHSITDILAAA